MNKIQIVYGVSLNKIKKNIRKIYQINIKN